MFKTDSIIQNLPDHITEPEFKKDLQLWKKYGHKPDFNSSEKLDPKLTR